MEIGLTPHPFVCFCLLSKRMQPPPLTLHPHHHHHDPLHDERWILYLKKSEKHIDVKTKNKEEVEGVYDNTSAFMYLNIKTHK